MDFLTPELLRILKHGRIYACHVRTEYCSETLLALALRPSPRSTAEATFHGLKHGFDYMGASASGH